MPVYFISNGKNLIKIGYSKDPIKRLAALQTASPDRLSLLAIKPGKKDVESQLHEEFKESRMEGEWFQLTPKLKVEIEFAQKYYPIDSFLHPSEEEKIIWEDAFADWNASVEILREDYDSKIEKLEEKIAELEADRDAKEAELDRIFDEKTEGIYPWWVTDTT